MGSLKLDEAVLLNEMPELSAKIDKILDKKNSNPKAKKQYQRSDIELVGHYAQRINGPSLNLEDVFFGGMKKPSLASLQQEAILEASQTGQEIANKFYGDISGFEILLMKGTTKLARIEVPELEKKQAFIDAFYLQCSPIGERYKGPTVFIYEDNLKMLKEKPIVGYGIKDKEEYVIMGDEHGSESLYHLKNNLLTIKGYLNQKQKETLDNTQKVTVDKIEISSNIPSHVNGQKIMEDKQATINYLLSSLRQDPGFMQIGRSPNISVPKNVDLESLPIIYLDPHKNKTSKSPKI